MGKSRVGEMATLSWKPLRPIPTQAPSVLTQEHSQSLETPQSRAQSKPSQSDRENGDVRDRRGGLEGGTPVRLESPVPLCQKKGVPDP